MIGKIIIIPLVLSGIMIVDSIWEIDIPVKNNQDDISSVVHDYSNAQAFILPISNPGYAPVLDSNVPRPSVNAKSALVYDLDSSKVLFDRRLNEEMPIASLTKILTAIVVMDNFDLDDVIIVSPKAVKADKEKQDLYEGEQITVESLLRMMIIESSNDAAYALAYHSLNNGFDLIDRINQKAREIGMTRSMFLDPAGLNDAAYSTSNDLIRLIKYSVDYSLIWSFSSIAADTVDSVDGSIVHNLENTNKLLSSVSGLVGGKTGYTDGALGCMITIVDLPDNSGRIISIVLGSEDRFGDTAKLIEWSRLAYSWGN